MAKKKKMEMVMLLKKSLVKEVAADMGFNSSLAFVEGLNEEVHSLMAKCMKRCELNGRATLKDRDL